MHRLLPLVSLCVCLALASPALAARSGPEIKAQFDAGIAAYDAGDYPTAFKLWMDLQYEDVAAMRNVAMMLRKGQGTVKNPKKAEEIYLRAAQAGLPTAQADLADMLLKGEAGPPDLQSALPLLQAAAAANHPIAQYQLGELYETGAPPLVPQNLEVARQLYAASASHGMKDAAARLAFLGPPQQTQLGNVPAPGETGTATVRPAAPVPAQAAPIH